MFVCVLDEMILAFCYCDFTLETGGFELASTINLLLQANGLTKCASHPNFIVNSTLTKKNKKNAYLELMRRKLFKVAEFVIFPTSIMNELRVSFDNSF